jgi:hypothetical protein
VTATTTLPPSLAPWAPALAALEVDLALALGPLVRQLDQLVTRNDPGLGAHGPLDGYAGLARRGVPDRMLISEWALAEVVPTEFLRRATAGELLYLDPAYQQDQLRGTVAVLVDCGPDQLGGGRLVQLAALIVLHRRASARGAELVLGVIGDEPGAWRMGDLRQILPGWLRSRRPTEPDAEQVDEWADSLQSGDEMWLLTGPSLAGQLPGRRRMLSSRESAWKDDGAAAVEVLLDGVRAELALPRHDLAVRALRGAGFRREPRVIDSGGAVLGPPVFPSAEPRLLARGRNAAELMVATLSEAGQQASRPRWHQMAGDVVAATFFPGRRLVALILVDGYFRAQVVGKRLGSLDQIDFPVETVGVDVDIVLADVAERPAPLHFVSGDLLCELAGTWWRISPDNEAQPESIVAIGPGSHPDQPRLVYPGDQPRWGRTAPKFPDDAVVVAGSRNALAWSKPRSPTWTLEPDGVTVTVEDGARVLGLAHLGNSTALVTVSSAGLLVRLVGRDIQQTLTRWSGGTHVPALHPIYPWLAVRRDDGRIEVADLSTSESLLTIRADQ